MNHTVQVMDMLANQNKQIIPGEFPAGGGSPLPSDTAIDEGSKS